MLVWVCDRAGARADDEQFNEEKTFLLKQIQDL